MKTRVVVEVSERYLKAVISGPGAPRNQIQKIILEPLENPLGISEALSKVFSSPAQKKGAEVIVVLSRNKMTLRRIDLPSRDRAEIEQMLSLHVIRQVPYPKEEIIWAWQNLGFDGISNSQILLAVIHRDIPRGIFNSFTSLNLLPEKVLMSSQGIVHYLRESVRDKSWLYQPYLVLDIDSNFSDLMLVVNQHLNSSIVISGGSEQLKTIEERSRLSAELKQALSALHSEQPLARPAQIFLTGASSDIPDLDTYLAEELTLKCQVIKSKELDNSGIASGAASLASVLGFSYQQRREDISFVLPEVQVKKEVKLKIQQLLILGVSLTYVFILSGAIALVKLSQLGSQYSRISSRNEQLKAETGDLVTFSQKINMVKQYLNPKQSVLNYLYEFNRICPENIILTNFTWEKGKSFIIRGYAMEMSDIFNFGTTLENSAFFKGMKTGYTRRRKIKDKEVVDFEMALK